MSTIAYGAGPMSEINVSDWLQNPARGLYQCEHFDEVIGSVKYTVTDTTGTGALLTTTAGGIFTITTTATDDQGSQIQAVASPFIATANRPIYMEGRFKFSLGIWVDFFFGLCTADTTIFSAGAMSTTENIGFYIDATSHAAANGYLQFRSKDSGTTDTLTATDFLIPAAVWIRLAMKIDLSALKAYLFMYNESTGAVKTKTVTLTAANVPNAACKVSLAAHSESQGATPVAATVDCDYIRTAQFA